MADPPTDTKSALESAETELNEAIGALLKARGFVKNGNDATKELEPQIELMYDECRDIYTRLAGLCADAALAAES